MVSHLDPVEFASFIDGIGESAQLELRDRFQPYLPQINARNVGEEIADLFAAIIREAAGTKRKSTPKQGAELDEAIDAHNRLEEKILASGQSMADAWEQAVNGLLEEGSNSTHGLNVAALSQGDRDILDTFRADSKEILLYIIDNDPAAGPTEVSLSDDIAQVIQKWQLRYREIENKVLRNLVADILKTINEYISKYEYVSYYLIRKLDSKSTIKLCDDVNPNIPTERMNVNPVKNSYAALWDEYKEVQSAVPLMNVIRRILEYYFLQLCGYEGASLRQTILIKGKVEGKFKDADFDMQ